MAVISAVRHAMQSHCMCVRTWILGNLGRTWSCQKVSSSPSNANADTSCTVCTTQEFCSAAIDSLSRHADGQGPQVGVQRTDHMKLIELSMKGSQHHQGKEKNGNAGLMLKITSSCPSPMWAYGSRMRGSKAACAKKVAEKALMLTDTPAQKLSSQSCL